MDENKGKKLIINDFPPVTTKEWEDTILADLKGADYEKKLVWKTYDGMAVRPYYRAEDLETLNISEVLPGHPPYTRGAKPGSNRWEIRQDIPGVDPKEISSLAVNNVKRGVTAIGIHASRLKEIADLESLFAEMNPEKTGFHFHSCPDYHVLTDLLITYFERHGLDKKKLKGSFQYDPLSELVLSGSLARSWEEEMQLLAGLIRKVRSHFPGLRPLNPQPVHFHNAGSSLVQELAFGLAAGNEYLAGLTDAGLDPEEILPSMMFSFAVGSDYFPEIAKPRAARQLWYEIVSHYGDGQVQPAAMYIHSGTSTWNMTLYDPHVNILRTTTEVMAAALGGADSISVIPFDAAFRVPDEFSMRIARNQQIIIQEEAYLGSIVDPGAGSYYIEYLTDTMKNLAWELFTQVEEKGGFIHCFQQHFIQDSIHQVKEQRLQDITARKTTILGTNQYPNLKENMLPKIQPDVYYHPSMTASGDAIPLSRGSELLEYIRLDTEKHIDGGAGRPVVFLFNIGNLAMQKARANFITNFFGCAGFEIIDNPGFESITDGVEACLDKRPEIVAVCSSDEEYPSLVPEICTQLKAKGYTGKTLVAGYPKDHIEALKDAGVYEFIHIRCPLPATLIQFQKILGIPSSINS